MFRQWLQRLTPQAQPTRRHPRACRRKGPWGAEGLEDRVLLAATLYTVSDTTDNVSDPNSIAYAVFEADNNTNPAGTVIEFSQSVFNTQSPGTIDMTSSLELTNSRGPISIDGGDQDAVFLNGGGAVQLFSVAAKVTAYLSDLTIQNGTASEGGGIDNAGNLTCHFGSDRRLRCSERERHRTGRRPFITQDH